MEWIKNWFSNFIPFDEPMWHEGIYYRTVEHFYAAMKSEDKNIRMQIAILPYPAQAKKAAQRIKLRSDWDRIKESVMWTALCWKYKEGTSHYYQLMATGDWDIVEWNNWHDNYWGNCICQECVNKEGKNRLGVLLMLLRNELWE